MNARPRSALRAAIGFLIVLVLAFAIPIAAAAAALYTLRAAGIAPPSGRPLIPLYVQHGYQLAFALLVIAVMKHFLPIDYGLHRPTRKSYFPEALAWGAVFGLLMALVDYAPQLVAHAKPSLGYPLTPRNLAGWLFFEGVYVGPTEEVPFRAMLIPFLAAMWPARARLGRFDMYWAGIVVALIFALLHATSFAHESWPIALGQQIYAFALGVLYAYWLEKSGSVLAPIVGHNASDFVEYALLFLWIGLL